MLCNNMKVTMWGVFRCIDYEGTPRNSLPLRVFTTDCPQKAKNYLWNTLCADFERRGKPVERREGKDEFTVTHDTGDRHTYFANYVSLDSEEASNYMAN
jgi:hypothetical protein